MSAYVFDGRWCFSCNFRRNEYRHLKQCVPQRYWPPESEWADNQPRVERLPQRIGIYPRSVYERAFPAVMERPRVISDQATREERDDERPEYLRGRPVVGGRDLQPGRTYLAIPDAGFIEAPELAVVGPGTACAIGTCGYTVPATSKNPPAAMRLHRAKSKAHKHA